MKIEKPISINAIKKLRFTGNIGGMRYMLEKIEKEKPGVTEETPKEERMEQLMAAHIFPGPYSYDNTPEEKITSREFTFSDEGYQEAIDWMNAEYASAEEIWKESGKKNILDE